MVKLYCTTKPKFIIAEQLMSLQNCKQNYDEVIVSKEVIKCWFVRTMELRIPTSIDSSSGPIAPVFSWMRSSEAPAQRAASFAPVEPPQGWANAIRLISYT